MSELALQRRLPEVVEEYEIKLAGLPQLIADFEAAGQAVISGATVSGTYGRESINTGSLSAHGLKASLLKSAWWHVYQGLNISQLASARDKKLFEQAMESPAPFTLENVRATFGNYLLDPRGNILRGLAEVFGDLDPAYKSHERVKIGVKGLPKRIIVGSMNSIYGYGRDKVRDVLNALAAYQGKPLVSHRELEALMNEEDALLEEWEADGQRGAARICYPARGVRLRRFSNGNGHLFFEPDTLRDINLALAEYYGDVLPDCHDAGATQKRQSTVVAKDLQYYPTPDAVVQHILADIYPCVAGKRVLEPSCGCGRFMDALRDLGADVFGVEVDAGRAEQCRSKGHKVLVRNFLEVLPTADYDFVVMNPPFYGKHYAKHVEHALKFLKPGGLLKAVLPVTARYDHGLLKGGWSDLPAGSFRESGTNINTTILTIRKS